MLVMIFNFECFLIIAQTITFITLHKHISQKLHWNTNIAFASTRFTTPTFYIETKFTSIIGAHASFGERSKQIANKGKHTSISRWIGTWCSANW